MPSCGAFGSLIPTPMSHWWAYPASGYRVFCGESMKLFKWKTIELGSPLSYRWCREHSLYFCGVPIFWRREPLSLNLKRAKVQLKDDTLELEYDPAEGMSDEEVAEDVKAIAHALDGCHRALGGHGLKVVD